MTSNPAVTTTSAELRPNDEIRQRVHGMWASVADQWAENADAADRRGEHVAAAMLEAVRLLPGERVLELACGPGGVGLAAAPLVGAAGEVVISDVVPAMVAIAADRAGRRGLTNVRTRVLDLEAIDAPDESYDVVLCREGLMFAADPLRACAEIHRVLRAGGRTSIAVWGPRQENPWLGIVLDAVGAVVGHQVPPPGMPGPFALDDRHRLEMILGQAGLVDVTIEPVPTPLRSPSFETWWARTTALAGPVATIIARLDAPSSVTLRDRLRDAVVPYTTDAGLELPGLTLLATARRGRT
jgi:ubiquinone/menaquinone biosynthesis C-methylase UbiE